MRLKHFSHLAAVLAIAFVSLFGVGQIQQPSPVSADAALVYHNNASYPTGIFVYNSCRGEFVFLTGTLHEEYHYVINGNNYSFQSNYNPQGVSGEAPSGTYHATGHTSSSFRGSFQNGASNSTYNNQFDIVGPNGAKYTVKQVYHYTFNANGTLTAFVDNFTFSCN